MSTVRERIDAERQRLLNAEVAASFIVLSLPNFRSLLKEMPDPAHGDGILATGKIDDMMIVVVSGDDIVEATPSVRDISRLLPKPSDPSPRQPEVMPWPPRWS